MNPNPTRRPRRLAALVAGLVAASLLLSGCLYELIPGRAPVSTESLPPDTQGVPAELLPYYDQELTWEPCTEGFDCTTVTAPLDWENPGRGKDIELALIRQRATDGDADGSLLVNPGGPGQSGIQLIRDSVDFATGERLQQEFDVIGFDPRGVGQSTAVRCYDAEEMDHYLFDIPENPRGSDAWTEELTEADKAFAEACEANSDGILPYITTQNAARDMDLLRAVLGDDKLNFLGYSYGSFLGATYAELFPDKVGHLVLDGATDPAIPRLEQAVVQGIGFENALRAYLEYCLGRDDCPFRGTVDEALADVGTLLASADRTPLDASDGRKMGADSLLLGIQLALYSRDTWDYLTIALADALQGNPDVAFQLADIYYDRDPYGVYTLNGTEAFTAYNCMDFPIEDDPDAMDVAQAQLDEGAPTIAPYLWGTDSCENWPYPPTGVREKITAEGAAPIVVVGTTGDPATPYEWAVSLADQLSSGVLLTRVGEGHTGYNKGNKCVDRAVEDYFVDDKVPDDGLRCE